MRNSNITVNDISRILEGTSALLYEEAKDTFEYKDNKRTDTISGITVSCLARNIGDVKVILPYKAKLADALNAKHEFGSAVQISELGDVQEVTIGIYERALNIKFICE